MFYNEDSWQKFREEALAYAANRERTVLQEWLDMVDYIEPVGYYLDTYHNVMVIYATRIGVLIGKGGVHVEELKKKLLEEYGRDFEVTFVEIRGGFVNV